MTEDLAAPPLPPHGVDDLPTVNTRRRPADPSATLLTLLGAACTPSSDFGDYELLNLIGRGGMGVIYRARHRRLGRVVALKMILAGQLASAEDVRRFHAEAEAAARLDHPGIVPLFEVGQHQGQHYYTMALVEGGSLADRLTGGPLPPRQAAELVCQVAEAVACAHRQGIVHRDLKPANILLDAAGQPRVSDFGLAKKLGGADSLTATGQILGTPGYMPPEQATGRSGPVGPAADIYALGAILYCLLTGRPPFEAASALATLQLVAESEPVPPRQLNPTVARALETVCLHCLHKEPGRRYATAQALADDLRRWLRGEPISTRPVGPCGRVWRWCRRHPAVAGSLAVAARTLLLGTVAASWFAVQANASALRADEQARHADASARRANERAYISDMRLAQRYWDDNLAPQAEEMLEGHRPTGLGSVDLRHFEWRWWHRRCRLTLRAFTHPTPVTALAIHPGGAVYAVADQEGVVRLCDRATGRELHVHIDCPEDRRAIRTLAFSPDGRLLLVASADRILRLRDGVTGALLRAFTGSTGEVRKVAFSPDGKTVASASADGVVRLWDVTTGRQSCARAAHKGDVLGLAFSCDGALFASAGRDRNILLWDGAGAPLGVLGKHNGTVGGLVFSPDRRLASAGTDAVRVWDVAGRKEVLTLQTDPDPFNQVAFSPDGSRLAAGRSAVRLWDAATGYELHVWKGHAHFVSGVAFTPDGREVLTSSLDATVRVWDPLALPLPLVYRGHASHVTAVAGSADGRLVASAGGTWDGGTNHYAGGELKLWEAATGKEVRTLVCGGAGISDVAFSPDGRLLASAGGSWDAAARRYRHGEVKLWDTATGAELACHRDHGGGVLCVAFSPDGRRLVSAGFDCTVMVQDARTGRVEWSRKDHAALVSRVAFTPDGQTVASAGFDYRVCLRSADTGEVRRTLPSRGQVSGLAISPDGRFLAISDYSPRTTVWDLEADREVLRLRGSILPVTCLAFSPDSKRLLAGSEDGNVRLYETKGFQEMLLLKGSPEVVRGVAFSGDGRCVLSGGWDRTVRVHSER